MFILRISTVIAADIVNFINQQYQIKGVSVHPEGLAHVEQDIACGVNRLGKQLTSQVNHSINIVSLLFASLEKSQNSQNTKIRN